MVKKTVTPTQYVSSAAEWNALTVSTGDTIVIDDDITFTSAPTPKTIAATTVVLGNRDPGSLGSGIIVVTTATLTSRG